MIISRLKYKLAQQYMSSDEYNQGKRYIPTEQDIKDSLQEPFKEIIKPIENEIKQYLQKEIRNLISSRVRHYIHKNNTQSNDDLYKFVLDNINFNTIFYKLKYEFDFYDYFKFSISPKQLEYEFNQYLRYHFSLYIRLLINKYKQEIILNIKQQQQDKNYHIDPYIRTPEQLDKIIDEIGDTIQLDQSFNINYKCRSSAFIFVKGQAFTGNSHINLLNKYMEDNNIDDQYYFNIENIDKIKLPYAYGHIYKGKALINWHKYCTAEEVKDALLKEGKYHVYDYNTNEQTLYRLAHLI